MNLITLLLKIKQIKSIVLICKKRTSDNISNISTNNSAVATTSSSATPEAPTTAAAPTTAVTPGAPTAPGAPAAPVALLHQMPVRLELAINRIASGASSGATTAATEASAGATTAATEASAAATTAATETTATEAATPPATAAQNRKSVDADETSNFIKIKSPDIRLYFEDINTNYNTYIDVYVYIKNSKDEKISFKNRFNSILNCNNNANKLDDLFKKLMGEFYNDYFKKLVSSHSEDTLTEKKINNDINYGLKDKIKDEIKDEIKKGGKNIFRNNKVIKKNKINNVKNVKNVKNLKNVKNVKNVKNMRFNKLEKKYKKNKKN